MCVCGVFTCRCPFLQHHKWLRPAPEGWTQAVPGSGPHPATHGQVPFHLPRTGQWHLPACSSIKNYMVAYRSRITSSSFWFLTALKKTIHALCHTTNALHSTTCVYSLMPCLQPHAGDRCLFNSLLYLRMFSMWVHMTFEGPHWYAVPVFSIIQAKTLSYFEYVVVLRF